jgi:hypothetical protein
MTKLSELNKLVESELYKPELTALHAVLATALSQYLQPYGLPPVWLMLIAPAGSGKTTFIECLNLCPNVWPLSTVTPKTFISAFDKKNEETSLLKRMGKSSIMTFKDFGGMASKRPDDKAEIFTQLRDIYDGSYSPQTGMGFKTPWKGRSTVIAAATPSIDSDRSTFRTLGDRFLELRWTPHPTQELAKFMLAKRQSINLKTIQEAVRDLLTSPLTIPDIDSKHFLPIWDLAFLVSRLRTPVHRDYTSRTITHCESPEFPTRIIQGLQSLMLTTMALQDVLEPNSDTFFLIERIAKDSTPAPRLALYEAIKASPEPLDIDSLDFASVHTIKRAAEDLLALNIVRESYEGLSLV